MKNKKDNILIFISILAFCIGTDQYYAQNGYISAGAGYNYSLMSDLKSLLNSFSTKLNDEDIPIKTVDDFPPYFFVEFKLFPQLNPSSVQWGAYFNYTSTGGKSDYRDYSGSVGMKELVNCFSLGLTTSIQIQSFTDSKLLFNICVGYIHTSCNISDYLTIGDLSQTDSFDFASHGALFSIGLSYQYLLGPFLIETGADARLIISSPLALSSNSDAVLQDNGHEVGAEWSGIKFGISLGYCW